MASVGQVAAGDRQIEHGVGCNGAYAGNGRRAAGNHKVASVQILNIHVEGCPESERIGIGGLVRGGLANDAAQRRPGIVQRVGFVGGRLGQQ